MAIPVQQFQPLTLDQTNPVMAGMQSANSIYNGLLKNHEQRVANKYQDKTLQEQLQKMQFENKILGEQSKFAPQNALAEALYNQARAPYMNAETGLIGQQSERMKQMLPGDLFEQRINNQNLDQKQKSSIAQAFSEAKKNNFQADNPLMSLPGVAGQLGAAIYMQQHPELGGQSNQGDLNKPTNDLSKTLLDSVNTNIRSKDAKAQYDIKRTGGYNYNSLPIDYKNQINAQLAGLGISPEEGVNEILKGKTVSDIAKEKGFDPNNLPEPINALTSTGRSRLQMRQQALAEVNALGSKISGAMAPYSSRFAGYSPLQVSQALKGEKIDSQAKFLAARALQPELAAIRLRMANGNVGIEAIRELTDSSMGHAKIYQSLVTPEVYQKTQNYIDNWLNDAVGAANKQALQPKKFQENNKKESDNDPLGLL